MRGKGLESSNHMWMGEDMFVQLVRVVIIRRRYIFSFACHRIFPFYVKGHDTCNMLQLVFIAASISPLCSKALPIARYARALTRQLADVPHGPTVSASGRPALDTTPQAWSARAQAQVPCHQKIW